MIRLMIIVVLGLQCFTFSQSFRLMNYNLLNYPGNDTTARNQYFRTIISDVKPDVLVVQEMISQAGVDGFLNNVLNSFGYYSAGVFINGPDTDNAIFIRDSLFEFLNNTPVKTALRDISEFKLLLKPTNDTLIIYSAHLKASQGSDNVQKRAAEVDDLRRITGNHSTVSNYFFMGDFNLYSSNEPAYQKMLDQSAAGYFLDPIDKPGSWNNNSSFASIHTQSPRTRQFGGGSNGGLDDRFDFILISQAVKDAGGITYINNSYTAFGNDGNHFNDSINKQPNTGVSVDVANALHYASDHLPVFADFSYDAVVPVELISFNGSRDDGKVLLNWMTGSESNSLGFSIERVQGLENSSLQDKRSDKWESIGFVKSAGNSTQPNNYHFTDNDVNAEENYYRLKMIDMDGSFTFSDVINVNMPLDFVLYQNYPNPFNPLTTISYSIPSAGDVKLSVTDLLGNAVTILENGFKESGKYEIKFNSTSLSSGIYFYSLKVEGYTLTRMLVVLK